MNAIVQQQPRDVAAQPERIPQAAPAENMLALLARAADPASGIDIDRMREIRALYQEIKADEARVAFAAAFSAMQGELPLVAQGGYDTHKQIRYSRLEDVLAAARPAMQRHGFGIDFDIQTGKDGITVTGTLTHILGHSKSTTQWYPVDTGPGRSAIQALGSSTTYGRRYVTMSLLNIASDKDDDGRGGDDKADEPKLSEKQVDDIRDLLNSVEKTEAAFLKWAGFKALAEIPAARFEEMMRAIKPRSAR